MSSADLAVLCRGVRGVAGVGDGGREVLGILLFIPESGIHWSSQCCAVLAILISLSNGLFLLSVPGR